MSRDFSNPHYPCLPGQSPAREAENPSVLALARKWADNHGKPVQFVDEFGVVVREIEPEV